MLLLECTWCEEAIEQEYMVFWRMVDGEKTDVSFVHLGCEEDFLEHSRHKYWLEKFMQSAPEIYVDPRIAAYRKKSPT